MMVSPTSLSAVSVITSFILSACWGRGVTRHAFAKYIIAFNDRIAEKYVLEEFRNIFSVLECEMKCTSHKSCFSYFFNGALAYCQTHCNVFGTDTEFVSSPGSSYYQLIHDECVNRHRAERCNRHEYEFRNEELDNCLTLWSNVENFLLYGPQVEPTTTPMLTTTAEIKTTEIITTITTTVKSTTTSTTKKPTTTTKTTTTKRAPTTPIIPIYDKPHKEVSSTCKWFGSKPFCSGRCDEGWEYRRSDGGGCWTGSKALCCQEGDNCVTQGKAPFCGSDASTCYERGQDIVRSYKGGCWTGNKVLCCDFRPKLGCNGMFELCDLRFDQVTFAGTHNSGSGYAGTLKYSFGLPALDCMYRNQLMSFTDQLTFGIRYFDIDLCWKDNRLYTCHQNAYAGTLTDVLEQISSWMSKRQNLNEVIAMRFHDYNNVPKSKGGNLISELTHAFSGEHGKPGLNDKKPRTYMWPTLREAINHNQRVVVFMANHLCDYSCRRDNKWVHASMYYGDTWQTRALSTSCAGIISETRVQCDKHDNKDLVQMSNIASYGLCVYDMARLCNKQLEASTLACLEERKKIGRTVNILLVDYPAQFDSKLVTTIAEEMNKRNILMFGR